MSAVPVREAAASLWGWCWARCRNLYDPRGRYASIVTVAHAPLDEPAIGHIDRTIRAHSEALRRENARLRKALKRAEASLSEDGCLCGTKTCGLCEVRAALSKAKK